MSQADHLSTTFAALADPTRRAILARLATGERSVTELAEPFEMSMPAVSKHLRVLERAGLIARGREAQWRPCRLEAAPLKEVAEWAERLSRVLGTAPGSARDVSHELQAKETKMVASGAANSATFKVTTPSDREIRMTRLFDAPRDLVFGAMNTPEHIKSWWGQLGDGLFGSRVRGRPAPGWRVALRQPHPNGELVTFYGVYREIDAPDRVVFTEIFEPFPDAESVVTRPLTEENGKTRLTVDVEYPSTEVRDMVLKSGMEQGRRAQLRPARRGRFGARAIVTDTQFASVTTPAADTLVVTRVFNAPRELVYAAWTEPKHLEKWQGAPKDMTTTSASADLRPGGTFNATMRAPDGTEHRLQGTYREVVPPERLVFTHTWLGADGRPGPETVVTMTFEQLGAKTKLTLTQTGLASTSSRDGHGIGWSSTFERMADYIHTLNGDQS